MIKAWGRNLLFFVAVSLAWLAGFASSPPVDPVIDDETPLRSVLYSATSLLAWAGLLLGGLWAASTFGVVVLLLALFVWGFLVAPVVVVVAMRLLFPGISARLRAELDRPGPHRATAR
jgi:hypothetical protein